MNYICYMFNTKILQLILECPTDILCNRWPLGEVLPDREMSFVTWNHAYHHIFYKNNYNHKPTYNSTACYNMRIYNILYFYISIFCTDTCHKQPLGEVLHSVEICFVTSLLKSSSILRHYSFVLDELLHPTLSNRYNKVSMLGDRNCSVTGVGTVSRKLISICVFAGRNWINVPEVDRPVTSVWFWRHTHWMNETITNQPNCCRPRFSRLSNFDLVPGFRRGLPHLSNHDCNIAVS